MSKRSDEIFLPTKNLYLGWIEKRYGITIKDIEHEFIQYKVLGNSVLNKDDAELIGKKLGLFSRPYTSVTKLAKEYNVSRSKLSNMVNDIYLKIAVKKDLKK